MPTRAKPKRAVIFLDNGESYSDFSRHILGVTSVAKAQVIVDRCNAWMATRPTDDGYPIGSYDDGWDEWVAAAPINIGKWHLGEYPKFGFLEVPDV